MTVIHHKRLNTHCYEGLVRLCCKTIHELIWGIPFQSSAVALASGTRSGWMFGI